MTRKRIIMPEKSLEEWRKTPEYKEMMKEVREHVAKQKRMEKAFGKPLIKTIESLQHMTLKDLHQLCRGKRKPAKRIFVTFKIDLGNGKPVYHMTSTSGKGDKML